MISKEEIRAKIEAVNSGESPASVIPEAWLQCIDDFVEVFTQLMHDYFFNMGDTNFNRSGLRSASDEVYNHVLGIESPEEISEPDYDVEHFDFWC